MSTTASAPCIAVRFTSAAVAMSTARSPAASVSARERSSIFNISHARRTAHALLRATERRHAHDQYGDTPSMHSPTPGTEADIAVKNLRFADSSVLLLNFREVRRFHFCSTSVAV
jgi:hypothetical protein